MWRCTARSDRGLRTFGLTGCSWAGINKVIDPASLVANWQRAWKKTETDVLCLPAARGLQTLVKDELIRALPIVPRHEGVCPQPLQPKPRAATAAPPKREESHPFAAWAALQCRRDVL